MSKRANSQPSRRNAGTAPSTQPSAGPVPPPPLVRWASIIAILQSLIGLGYAVLLLVRQATGQHDESIVNEGPNNMAWVGTGTAVFFIIVFGVVLSGAIGMLRSSSRLARGPVVILQVLLVLISFQMFGGGAIILGIVTLVSAAACLAFLFSPRSVEWASRNYLR